MTALWLIIIDDPMDTKVVDPILGPIQFIMFSILDERALLEQSSSKVWAENMQRFYF